MESSNSALLMSNITEDNDIGTKQCIVRILKKTWGEIDFSIDSVKRAGNRGESRNI